MGPTKTHFLTLSKILATSKCRKVMIIDPLRLDDHENPYNYYIDLRYFWAHKTLSIHLIEHIDLQLIDMKQLQ